MKRFNFDELLWFIILILLDISISYLILSNKIDFYVGKKMIKYAYFTVIMISIISVFQLTNIFTCKGSTNLKIKLIPIILALMLGGISIETLGTFKHSELNKELKSNSIDIKSLYEYESNFNIIDNKNNLNLQDKISLNRNNEKNSEGDINVSKGKEDELLIINEDNAMKLEDIRVNPKNYIGKKLIIHGFVCKENYLNQNQFIIGRIVITCCAADSKIVGIIGEYDKAGDLNENDKVIVTGRISSSNIKDDNNVNHRVPVIQVEKIEAES